MLLTDLVIFNEADRETKCARLCSTIVDMRRNGKLEMANLLSECLHDWERGFAQFSCRGFPSDPARYLHEVSIV